MTIEQEIAQRIDKELDGDCGYGIGEWLASKVMPLVRRAQAEALRDAAADNEHGWALRTWLNKRADRIERNSEGSK